MGDACGVAHAWPVLAVEGVFLTLVYLFVCVCVCVCVDWTSGRAPVDAASLWRILSRLVSCLCDISIPEGLFRSY